MRGVVGLAVFLLGVGVGFAEKEPVPDYAVLFAENDAKIRAIDASDPSCTNYVQWMESAISYKRKLRLQNEIEPWLEELAVTSNNNWKMLHAVARGYALLEFNAEVDRWRSIKLMDQAYILALEEFATDEELGRLVEDFIDLLWVGRGERPYLLKTKTLSLSKDEVVAYPTGNQDRELIFFECPPSSQDAANDGELIRWLIEKGLPPSYAGEYKPSARRMADFAVMLAGVHRASGYALSPGVDETLHALKDDETLQVGGKNWGERVTLPKAYRYIPIYRELAEQGNQDAANTLGNIHFNRFQFERAAQYYELAGATNAVDSIRSNQGEIVACPAQVGGQPASFDYTYRNGSELLVEIVRISPTQFQERMRQGKITPDELSFLSGAEWYSSSRWMKRESVAEWSVTMDPHPDHWDRMQKIELPLLEAGNYRIITTLKGCKSTERPLFLSDTLVLLNKVRNKTSSRVNFSFLFADAATGQALGDQDFHLVGWDKKDKLEQTLKGRTDRHGCYVFEDWELDAFDRKVILLDRESRGLIACRVPYDPGYYSYGKYPDREIPSIPRTFFCTTDRPVYRPGDTGVFKVAFGVDPSPLTLEIQGRKSALPFDVNGALEQTLTVSPDLHGGADGHFHIPKDAKPGRYTIDAGTDHKNIASSFLVEEYNAPEYRVSATLLPSGTIEVVATDIEGKPLAKNTDVRVTTSFSWHPTGSWCPADRYDFRFGRGHWWHGGQLGPRGETGDMYRDVRIDVTGTLDADGRFRIKLAGDDLLNVLNIPGVLSIDVEVINSGAILFEESCRLSSLFPRNMVCCWLDKAFFNPSEIVRCHVALEHDVGNPVLELSQVTGTNTVMIKQFPVTAESVSLGRLPSGLYEVQAGVEGNKSKPFRFIVLGGLPEGLSAEHPLRVVREKGRYESGDTARMLLQADRPGRAVYLFRRTFNSKPVVVQMTSVEQIINLPISEEDVNFGFFAAMTVEGGEPCFFRCNIPVVDPDVPVGLIEIEPDWASYRPGDTVSLALRASDDAGNGHPSSIAVSIYNKGLAEPVKQPDVRQLFSSIRNDSNSEYGYMEMYDNWPPVYRPSGIRNRLMEFWHFKGGLPFEEREFWERYEYHLHSFPSFGHDYRYVQEDRLHYTPKPSAPNTEFQSTGDPCHTAYWNATIETDAEGRATVEFPLPEGEADWKIRAWAISTNYAASAEATLPCRNSR